MAAGNAGKNNDVISQMGKQLDHAEESLQDMQKSIADQKKSRKLLEGDKNKGQEPPGKGRGKEGGTLGKVAGFFDDKDKGRDI